MWTLITFPWVKAELRREKESWSLVQQNHGGEPFTDDITANPRTRMRTFHNHILPSFVTREKPTSPESLSTTEDRPTSNLASQTTETTAHTDFVGAATTEEGIIGAGGLERSASRPSGQHHEHEHTISNDDDPNRDLEKQENTAQIPDGL